MLSCTKYQDHILQLFVQWLGVWSPTRFQENQKHGERLYMHLAFKAVTWIFSEIIKNMLIFEYSDEMQ